MRWMNKAEAALDANANGFFTVGAILSPAAVATITNTEQTFNTFTGIRAGDHSLSVIKPTAQAGVGGGVQHRVTAAATIGLSWANPTAGNVTPTASEYYEALCARPPKN